eukprot:scaffold60512_cov57-Attheya_sp.AAC.1
MALTYEHVAGMIVMCTKQWSDDLPPRAQYQYILAAPIIVDICAGWLGWLRGGEIFGLSHFGPLHGLATMVGALLVFSLTPYLNPATDPAFWAKSRKGLHVEIAYKPEF